MLLTLVLGYLLVTIAIGLFAARRVKKSDLNPGVHTLWWDVVSGDH